MICIEPLSGLPTACALAPDTGRAQLEKRHAFDDDYLHSVEGAETRMVVHYSKVRDSTRRLRALPSSTGRSTAATPTCSSSSLVRPINSRHTTSAAQDGLSIQRLLCTGMRWSLDFRSNF